MAMGLVSFVLLGLSVLYSAIRAVWVLKNPPAPQPRSSSPKSFIMYGGIQLGLFAAVVVTGAMAPKVLGIKLLILVALVVFWAMLGGEDVVMMALAIAHKVSLSSSSRWEIPDLPASEWIGMAERTAITLALCLGQGELAAVILGIKALGQYKAATKDTAATLLLGTVVSALWALCCFSIMQVATYDRAN